MILATPYLPNYERMVAILHYKAIYYNLYSL